MAISFVNTGAYAERTTAGTLTPALPTSWAAKDLLICFAFGKYDACTFTMASAGWTEIGSGATTTGDSAGNDRGNMHGRAWYKLAEAGETAPNITVGGTVNVVNAHITAYRTSLSNAGYAVLGGIFADSSAGSPLSAVTTNHNGAIDIGDFLHYDQVVNGDIVTWGTTTVSTTGVTWAAVTNVDASTIGGTDMRMRQGRTNATVAAAISETTVSTTLAGTVTNARGIVLILRVRERAASPLVLSEGAHAHAADNVVLTQNIPPVAHIVATPTTYSDPLDVIALDGTGSSDADGTIASYLWELVSAPEGYSGTFSAPTGSTTNFTPALQSYSAEVLADSPILYMRFEEASGSAASEVGSFTGTIDGATQNQTGQEGKAVLFDGSNDRILISTVTGLKPSAFTVEAWIKTSSSGASRRIFRIGPYGFSMAINGSNKLAGEFYDSGAVAYGVESTNVINGDTWKHVAYKYDSTTGSELFINGVSEGGNPGHSATVHYPGGETAAIGADGHSASAFWLGLIDEFAIFASALSDERIAAHYAARTI